MGGRKIIKYRFRFCFFLFKVWLNTFSVRYFGEHTHPGAHAQRPGANKEMILAVSAMPNCASIRKERDLCQHWLACVRTCVSVCCLCRDCKASPSHPPCTSEPSVLLPLHPSNCQSSSRKKWSLSVPNTIITCIRLIVVEGLQRGKRKQGSINLYFLWSETGNKKCLSKFRG